MVVHRKSLIVLFAMVFTLAMTSHIDDIDGELSNFSWDRVIFRLRKDCSLDKMPDIKYFLEEDGGKYPDLDIYLSDGEPRFELSKNDKLVDTIRVHRYDIKAIRKLLEELGVKRDEAYSYEKKAAELELKSAFGVPHPPPPKKEDL